MAGLYSNILVFTATTNYVPPSGPCGTGDYECILFTIDTTDGTYSIPTSGRVANMDHTYDWDVYVDGILTTDCPSGNCTGTGSDYNAPGVDGIALTGLSNGEHQIKILPHSSPTPGWGNAFGHGGWGESNSSSNLNKLISIDAPLTTMAFSPKTTESTTNAERMFALMFNGCPNLTTPARIIDTYKLPNTVTILSKFLSFLHSDNKSLTAPIDLSGLSGWLNKNNSITDLPSFMIGVHYDNFFTNPINLTPISGWFDANSSITDLSQFLSEIHSQNPNLTHPIDLTPVSGWFVANNSITDLSNFISEIHYWNDDMTETIDLTPLSEWFSSNRSFSYLNRFLYETHMNNPNLTLSGQMILPNWIKTATQGATSIWNVLSTFYRTFYTSTTKNGDTGEPRFQDGTVLSSLGTPTTNNQAYTNRSGITPVNTNWK